MSQGENKLINDTVCAYGTRDERERRVIRVAEDEVVCIEGRKPFLADASSASSSAQFHSVTEANAASRPFPEPILYPLKKREGGLRHRRYVVHIRLRHHGSHCLLHSPLSKLVETMLIPYSL